MADFLDVANALAAAFLAEGNWTRAKLTERAALAIGERPSWLSKVSARVLAKFQDPPAGRLRELARFVASDRNLRKACRGANPPSIRTWLVPRVDTRKPRWKVRPLSTAGDVAQWLGLAVRELDWFADPRGLEREVTSEPLRHYRYRWVSKRSDGSGGVRLLEAPKSRMKAIQRKVLREVLDNIPPHDAVHGFRRNRSVRTHAAPHAGQAVVMRLDLADFFLSISAPRVAAIFRGAGYPEEVAFVLSRICTNRAPVDAIARRGLLGPYAVRADLEAWRRAEVLARTRHLPQGSPTSPALANLAAYGLDVRLSAVASAAGAAYTRYADDLVFSGTAHLARGALSFAALVGAIVLEEGFVVNHRKTRVMRAGGRQTVTGLVVNDRPRVSRDAFDRLKATLHNCVRLGPATQNRDSHANFRAYLGGLVAWAAASDTVRGERLTRMLEEIRWG
jgi:RNA-directed DNA polymerase